VHSINDSFTVRKNRILESSHLLDGYSIYHSYVLNYEQSYNLPDDCGEVTSHDLFLLVSSAIKEFYPNYVLVHTGLAYHRFTNVYFETFRQIKDSYPTIKIGFEGLQGRPSYAMHDTQDVQDMVDLVFRRVLTG